MSLRPKWLPRSSNLTMWFIFLVGLLVLIIMGKIILSISVVVVGIILITKWWESIKNTFSILFNFKD